MPVRSELPPGRREAVISKKQRQELIDSITEKIAQETDPRWVLHPAWESIEPYTYLIPMIGALESDPPLSGAQESHLRKIAAWQATSIDRGKVTGMKGFREFWHETDAKIGAEMSQIIQFPDDLKGVSQAWKRAFMDWQEITAPRPRPDGQ